MKTFYLSILFTLLFASSAFGQGPATVVVSNLLSPCSELTSGDVFNEFNGTYFSLDANQWTLQYNSATSAWEFQGPVNGGAASVQYRLVNNDPNDPVGLYTVVAGAACDLTGAGETFSVSEAVEQANGCINDGLAFDMYGTPDNDDDGIASVYENLEIPGGATLRQCVDIDQETTSVVVSGDDDLLVTVSIVAPDNTVFLSQTGNGSATASFLPGEFPALAYEFLIAVASPGPLTEQQVQVDITGTTGTSINLERGTIIITPEAPAPVTLSAFSGRYTGKQTVLDWTTQTETDNAGFEVQRSLDGEAWTAIDFLPGTNVPNATADYQFVDDNPAAGTNYYRLKQNDFDGTFEFSRVVTVEAGAVTDVAVFPNPTHDVLNVRFAGDDARAYRVFNAAGAVVSTGMVNPNGRLEVGNLVSGIYVLTVTDGVSVVTRRFSKQ